LNTFEGTQGFQVLERKVFADGETIFREGDEGGRAYIIQSGQVNIEKKFGDEVIVVGTVTEGGIFGEMAFIDNEPRMATAVASGPCVCIIATYAMFQKKLRKLDPFLAGVLRILVENIRSIQDAKKDNSGLEAMFTANEVEIVDEEKPELKSGEPALVDA